jgi:hypothetical protein
MNVINSGGDVFQKYRKTCNILMFVFLVLLKGHSRSFIITNHLDQLIHLMNHEQVRRCFGFWQTQHIEQKC